MLGLVDEEDGGGFSAMMVLLPLQVHLQNDVAEAVVYGFSDNEGLWGRRGDSYMHRER